MTIELNRAAKRPEPWGPLLTMPEILAHHAHGIFLGVFDAEHGEYICGIPSNFLTSRIEKEYGPPHIVRAHESKRNMTWGVVPVIELGVIVRLQLITAPCRVAAEAKLKIWEDLGEILPNTTTMWYQRTFDNIPKGTKLVYV